MFGNTKARLKWIVNSYDKPSVLFQRQWRPAEVRLDTNIANVYYHCHTCICKPKLKAKVVHENCTILSVFFSGFFRVFEYYLFRGIQFQKDER